MMGTADALPIEPVTKPTFVEDLTENQLAKAVSAFCLTFFYKFAFQPFQVKPLTIFYVRQLC